MKCSSDRGRPWSVLRVALLAFAATALAAPARAADELFRAGAASVDITPEGPVRLNGFGFRRTESEGVIQRIRAQALAIEDASGRLALLLAVDNLGLPYAFVERVAKRIEAESGIGRERVAVSFTHSHTTPMVSGACPTIFGEPIPEAHQANIDRYTKKLEDDLTRVAREALAKRRPAHLAVGRGEVGFARNRRTSGGPVDHDLPVLVARDSEGQVIAICATYACHCVTLSTNHVSGDWAGFAREAIEEHWPGAVGLITIGCGADANPDSGVTGGDVGAARRQGREIADEIARVLAGDLRPLPAELECRFETIALPFATPPDRAEWERRALAGGATGYHARVQLARLDRGEALREDIEYPIATWTFGDSLAMAFLAGEVVVDYARRLERELDSDRVWIHAYSNAFPFYIPSERVLREGGYEGGAAHIYFDVPGPFAPGVEDRVVAEVRRQVPPAFRSPHAGTDGFPPHSPEESLEAFVIEGGFRVELAAAEPLVVDPVAIDFGPDGRLWVAEMRDYPLGIDGELGPGGTVRVLTDDDGDGRFDRADVFLEKLPFPTGVTVWRDAVLICAAPDIILARDHDGDGKADEARVLYTGFATHNYQARVNGLTPSLDNWLHGATGLFGGRIRSYSGIEADVENRDFRVRPETGAIDAVSGRSQQGRVRNDEGDWFGCENGSLAFHFPLDDRWVRRNPWTLPPPPRSGILQGIDSGRLFPAGGNQVLFLLSGPPGRVTSACGIGVYRDDVLGESFRGNLFTCEPVNGVVHRRVLSPRGSTFDAVRASDEAEREFLASTDNWFRPVQVRTGPDGALWIADMVRYVIEHPQWIPPERLATVDVRAGAERGRIWRVVPRDRPLRPVENLGALASEDLVPLLESPNGVVRDRAQEILVARCARETIPALERLITSGTSGLGRLHALGTLAGLRSLSAATLRRALADDLPAVRRLALELAAEHPERRALARDILALGDDPDGRVVLALAGALGELATPEAGSLLVRILERYGSGATSDPWIRGAALSSAVPHLAILLERIEEKEGRPALADDTEREIIRTAARAASGEAAESWIESLVRAGVTSSGTALARSFDRAAFFLDASRRDRDASPRFAPLFERARAVAADASASLDVRTSAISLLGRDGRESGGRTEVLSDLLGAQEGPSVKIAALRALGRSGAPRVASLLLDSFETFSPQVHAEVEELLLSRPEWTVAWIEWLEEHPQSAATVDPTRRDRLLEIESTELRDRATALFEGLRRTDRESVIAEVRAAIEPLSGDRARGAEVFSRICAPCHRLRGIGRDVGPSLAELSDRTTDALLVAILDPNRAVSGSSVAYTAVLDDGRILSGIVSNETSTSLTLLGAAGEAETILRNRIQRLESTGRSLMPEGLESNLSPGELRDVIEFVQRSVPEPLGSGSEADFLAARDALAKEGISGLGRVIAAAEVFPSQASWLGPVPLHLCRETDGEGRVVWETRDVSPESLSANSLHFLVAAAMGWRSQPRGEFELRLGNRTLLDFDVSLADARWESDDRRAALEWTVLQRNGEDAVGRIVIEIDAKLAAELATPGQPLRFEVRGSPAASQRWFGLLVPPGAVKE